MRLSNHPPRARGACVVGLVGVIVPGVLFLAACGTKQSGEPLVGTGKSAGGTVSAGTATVRPGKTATLPPPSPTPSGGRIVVGRSGQVTLTQSDNGATVILARHQRIIVVLGGQGFTSWDRPIAAGPGRGLLRRVSVSGGYPSSSPARATFLAVGRGFTVLRSMTDAACLHKKPLCQLAQQVWQVSVLVRT